MLNQKILIVDDDESIREILSYFFLNQYQVVQACCGNEALEIIKTENINIIFTDLKMENGNGIELIQNIITIPVENRPIICTISAFQIEHVFLDETFDIEKYIYKQYPKPFNFRQISYDLDQLRA